MNETVALLVEDVWHIEEVRFLMELDAGKVYVIFSKIEKILPWNDI